KHNRRFTANRVSLYLAQPTGRYKPREGGWMPWQLSARLPARRGNISLDIPFYRTTYTESTRGTSSNPTSPPDSLKVSCLLSRRPLAGYVGRSSQFLWTAARFSSFGWIPP